jgi:hypothetical protein
MDGGNVMMTAQSHAIVCHRYGIGILVRLTRIVPLRNAVPGPYEVLAQLPEREGELQYRIKSDREPYQRIAKERELERV